MNDTKKITEVKEFDYDAWSKETNSLFSKSTEEEEKELAADKLYLQNLRSRISENIKKDSEKNKRNESVDNTSKSLNQEKKRIAREKLSNNKNEFESLKSKDKERKRKKREEQFKQTEEKLQDMSMKTKKIDKVSQDAEKELLRMKELAKRLLSRSLQNEDGFKETLDFIEASEKERKEEEKKQKAELKAGDTHWTEEERNKWPANEPQDSSKGFTSAFSVLKVANMGKNELDTLKGSITNNVNNIKKDIPKKDPEPNTSLPKKGPCKDTTKAAKKDNHIVIQPLKDDSVNVNSLNVSKHPTEAQIVSPQKSTLMKDEKREYSKLSTIEPSPTETKKVTASSVLNESEMDAKSKLEPRQKIVQLTAKSGLKQDNIATLKMKSSEKESLVKENMAEVSNLTNKKPTLQETKSKKTQENDAAQKTPVSTSSEVKPTKKNETPLITKPLATKKLGNDDNSVSNGTFTQKTMEKSVGKKKSIESEPMKPKKVHSPNKEVEKPKTVIKFKDGNISEIIKAEPNTDMTSSKLKNLNNPPKSTESSKLKAPGNRSIAAKDNENKNNEIKFEKDKSIPNPSQPTTEEQSKTKDAAPILLHSSDKLDNQKPPINSNPPKPVSETVQNHQLEKDNTITIKKDSEDINSMINVNNGSNALSNVIKVKPTELSDDAQKNNHLKPQRNKCLIKPDSEPSKSKEGVNVSKASQNDMENIELIRSHKESKDNIGKILKNGSEGETISEKPQRDRSEKPVQIPKASNGIHNEKSDTKQSKNTVVENSKTVSSDKIAKVHSVNPTSFIPKKNEVDAIKLGSPSLMRKAKSEKNYQISKVPTEIVMLPSKKAILNSKEAEKNIQMENYAITRVPTQKFVFNKHTSQDKGTNGETGSNQSEVKASVVISVTRPPPPKSKPPPPPPSFKPPPPPPLF